MLTPDLPHQRRKLLAVEEAGELLDGLEVGLDGRGERLAAHRYRSKDFASVLTSPTIHATETCRQTELCAFAALCLSGAQLQASIFPGQAAVSTGSGAVW